MYVWLEITINYTDLNNKRRLPKQLIKAAMCRHEDAIAAAGAETVRDVDDNAAVPTVAVSGL